ncbi:hypothetical protein P22_3503 [Propionispora sp. 2/2-37]|uniref:ABC transporter ATP-binding protein n=1 Tax=Propionispora sp. 2/2-37 TaxID=1677858 RepID=UPI0006BB88EF|nr:ATP-binding cassette domain-containing protein [Propionispora sp. 2/2-37]CUH97375.1 hypothetical protein P22_3503 [Propionispora sp. 2/2-37]
MRLEATALSFRYRTGPWIIRHVDFAMEQDERVVLLAPSGRGKSTLLKLLAGYEMPSAGRVTIDGTPLPRQGYCPVQLIYQHPEKAVNPRWKLRDIVSEGYQPEDQLLKELGIEPAWLERWPNELSGGELQRFCIARALGPQTRFLLADEISTMLDAISQAQLWDVLVKATQARGVGLLAVTHHAALAKQIATRIVEWE